MQAKVKVVISFSWRLPIDPAKAPNLRWIQHPGEGVDRLLGTPLIKSDIIVTNASGVHALPIAEYVFASILAFSRRIPYLLQLQREREWKPFWEIPGERLHGKTIGIVGCGEGSVLWPQRYS